jgi:hypothetical protein
MTDVERKDRLAFAIRAAMGKRSAQEIADAMTPRKSKETVARWARGSTIPSALDIGPLARALGVRSELLVDPPAMPSYPLSEYLVDEAVAVGQVQGRGLARRPREVEVPSGPEPSPRRPSVAGRQGSR